MTQASPLQSGPGGLSKLVLQDPDKGRAEIFLHGAHVTSWIPADGRERLFLSRTAEFAPGKALRGGVPVIFPQFASLGPLVKHGFARNRSWELLETGPGSATLGLEDDEATRALWPHAFQARLRVELGAGSLSMTLTVRNTDRVPFSFTAALHTYLRVGDCSGTAIRGLGGLAYRDHVRGDAEAVQTEDLLGFEGEVDRTYLEAPSPLEVLDGERRLEVRAEGFADAVTWNPGPDLASRLGDLEPEGHRRFVCLEAAAIGRPIHLAPGEAWQGSQILVAG